MNVFYATLLSGLAAVLTPAVFLIIIISSSLFEKLASTKKQYIINVFFFAFFTITIYVSLVSQCIKPDYRTALSENILVYTLLFSCMGLVFLLWFISSFFEKYQSLHLGAWKLFFRFFGLLIYSSVLALASFSSSGPILGVLLFSESDNQSTVYIITSLFGFSFGIIIPFIIVLCACAINYHILRQKKWWGISQMVIAGILLLNSIVFLITMMLESHFY